MSDPFQPHGCSPPGSSVLEISQARILEWLPFPSPGDFPDPGIKPVSPALQADSLLSEPPEKPPVESYILVITLNVNRFKHTNQKTQSGRADENVHVYISTSIPHNSA